MTNILEKFKSGAFWFYGLCVAVLYIFWLKEKDLELKQDNAVLQGKEKLNEAETSVKIAKEKADEEEGKLNSLIRDYERNKSKKPPV